MGFKRTKVEQHPIEMSVSIVLEALNGLDEVNFAFEGELFSAIVPYESHLFIYIGEN